MTRRLLLALLGGIALAIGGLLGWGVTAEVLQRGEDRWSQ